MNVVGDLLQRKYYVVNDFVIIVVLVIFNCVCECGCYPLSLSFILSVVIYILCLLFLACHANILYSVFVDLS